jgi:PPOX class probable F420-dependent enzyme
MTFQHVTGFIPFNKIDTWLHGFRSIWIATTRPDGRPHAVPVWYLWDGEHVYFAANGKSQKDRNLAQQPAIVVHAGDGDDAIVLEGTAELVTSSEERSRVNLAYMEKYVDPHSGAKANIPDGDVLYRVTVERIMCWEYGVFGTRTDWQRER